MRRGPVYSLVELVRKREYVLSISLYGRLVEVLLRCLTVAKTPHLIVLSYMMYGVKQPNLEARRRVINLTVTLALFLGEPRSLPWTVHHCIVLLNFFPRQEHV
jgi:hypothetical protein